VIPIPDSIDEVTPAWLTEVLRADGAIDDESVVGFSSGRAAGGIAITGVVRRLKLEYDRPAPRAPASVVVKIRNPAFESVGRHYLTEVAFYRDLAAELDLAVPRCHHAAIDEAGERFALVLQDLTGLRPGHPLDGMDEASTRALLDALADLQAAWWESPRLAEMDGWAKTYPPERVERITKGYAEAWPRFLDAGEYEVAPEVRELGERVLPRLAGDLERFVAPPRTLVHQDMHVENLLLEETDGRIVPYILDWQNAVLASPVLDLCNAIGGNTRPDVLDALGPALLCEFHRALVDRGVEGYPTERLVDDHRAAIRWLFLGQVWFLSRFEPETDHDRRTVTLEWERVAHALVRMGE
jgi:aminoglycoside phosphotransferase (APT) family kinase protein